MDAPMPEPEAAPDAAEALFDDAPYRMEPTALDALAELSPDRRRTIRQADAITRGVHPLGLVFPRVRMHPDADRAVARSDARGLPLTCGTCVFRKLLHSGDRAYPKCTRKPAFQTHSAATDIRAWWPACTAYEGADDAAQ